MCLLRGWAGLNGWRRGWRLNRRVVERNRRRVRDFESYRETRVVHIYRRVVWLERLRNMVAERWMRRRVKVATMNSIHNVRLKRPLSSMRVKHQRVIRKMLRLGRDKVHTRLRKSKSSERDEVGRRKW